MIKGSLTKSNIVWIDLELTKNTSSKGGNTLFRLVQSQLKCGVVDRGSQSRGYWKSRIIKSLARWSVIDQSIFTKKNQYSLGLMGLLVKF